MKEKLSAKEPRKPIEEVELHPDAKRRFERAIDAAVKCGPAPRTKTKND